MWAISRCLAGEAGEHPRDFCRVAVRSLLKKGGDSRRFAVRCLTESIDDLWAFEELLKVISEEERVRDKKEITPTEIYNTILGDALHPFMVIDYRLTQLPMQRFSKIEGLSPAARWAVASILHHIAVIGQYQENRELLIDLLLKAAKDSSQRVRSEAINGLGEFACHEKYSGSGEVPKTVIDALNEAASSRQWPESQTAIEYLHRLGEIEINEEWTRREVKNTIQIAETCLSNRNTEFGASLAVNFFDEIIGPIICEAIDELGDEKFEKLLLLALPEASWMYKDDIIWHLSRVGNDASVSALVKEVISRPNTNEPMGDRIRLAAANALGCIRTKKGIDALFSLTQHELWDVRLLAIMSLLRSPTSELKVKVKNFKDKIAECWLESKGEMLELMCRVSGGLLYSRETSHSLDSDDFTINPVVDSIISQLPPAELRIAARDMLIKGTEARFACRVLEDIGTIEDLPYLHKKLGNSDIYENVKNAMERIQERAR